MLNGRPPGILLQLSFSSVFSSAPPPLFIPLLKKKKKVVWPILCTMNPRQYSVEPKQRGKGKCLVISQALFWLSSVFYNSRWVSECLRPPNSLASKVCEGVILPSGYFWPVRILLRLNIHINFLFFFFLFHMFSLSYVFFTNPFSFLYPFSFLHPFSFQSVFFFISIFLPISIFFSISIFFTYPTIFSLPIFFPDLTPNFGPSIFRLPTHICKFSFFFQTLAFSWTSPS